MLEGSGWAVGFSPTTGGGVFDDLLAQPLTISSGSSKASKTVLFLGEVSICNLLLVSGVDLTLAERVAGVIERDAAALGLLRRVGGFEVAYLAAKAPVLNLPTASKRNGASGKGCGDVGVEAGDHRQALHQNHHIANRMGFISRPNIPA
jgi:hypothetical protein